MLIRTNDNEVHKCSCIKCKYQPIINCRICCEDIPIGDLFLDASELDYVSICLNCLTKFKEFIESK